MISFCIGRPINGIALNGIEYCNDGDGDTITFDSKDELFQFAFSKDISRNDFDKGLYIICDG